MIGVAIGFVCALVVGALLLPLLRRWQLRQHAYEDAPETHQVKTGTPTMGGLVFVVALGVGLAVWWALPLFRDLVLLAIACAAIGLIDDVLSIVNKSNRGLRARTKFLLTALVASAFLRAISDSMALFPRNVIFHAGTFALVVPYWLWLLLGILAITGTIHAVNLTDGLDGLAAGCMVPPLAALFGVAMSVRTLLPQAATICAIGIGACLGFLVYNRHPAKMFMGDTGSLALGALLSGVAIVTGEMLLLILVGGVFVAEALSVIVQVLYFKATQGKRIFRMSPLHHHFELGGWPETKVTTRFWLASLLCSVIGWAIAR
jgi:phospho-N-acetylmuramoyl-pentapeptide-transferase